MSLLSSAIDFLNNAQPVASAILDGVNAAFWTVAIFVSFVVTAQ